MITNPHNTKGWPEVVKKDTEKQIQKLRNNIDEVQIFDQHIDELLNLLKLTLIYRLSVTLAIEQFYHYQLQ